LANLLGRTSKYLRERFPRLKRLCGPDHLWSQAHYAGTVGQVSAETIRRYIQECQGK
jgi:putative transposase